MHQSLLRGAPVEMDARSVASGLAPPSAGGSRTPGRGHAHNCKGHAHNCRGHAPKQGRQGGGVWAQRPKGDPGVCSLTVQPFQLCARFVAGVVQVSEQQIRAAVASLFRAGLVVEPSGAAAFAAIANDRIPDLEGRRVVCVLSGGNIGSDGLAHF